MPSVEEVAAQIVAREGGYVNDPDDPGGATNYGVTIGTMKSLGLDLNKDGRVDATDVKMLTRAQAQQIPTLCNNSLNKSALISWSSTTRTKGFTKPLELSARENFCKLCFVGK